MNRPRGTEHSPRMQSPVFPLFIKLGLYCVHEVLHVICFGFSHIGFVSKILY